MSYVVFNVMFKNIIIIIMAFLPFLINQVVIQVNRG